jgi:low temperature requirement protein LtrA
MVALWLRAATSDPERRRCALRYAVGIAVAQIGWVAWLQIPVNIGFPLFAVLAAGELAVPLWAEAAGRTAWHPGHIAERYGLFTIIVLGELLLATTAGVHAALGARATFGELATVVIGGLLTVFSLWWMYFDLPTEDIVTEVRSAFSERISGAFVWGYGHYVVFASAAAVGAGLSVAIDRVTGHSVLTRLETGFALTVPVVLYVLVVWAIHAPYKAPSRTRRLVIPTISVLIVSSSLTPEPVLATGVLLAILVASNVETREAAAAPDQT